MFPKFLELFFTPKNTLPKVKNSKMGLNRIFLGHPVDTLKNTLLHFSLSWRWTFVASSTITCDPITSTIGRTRNNKFNVHIYKPYSIHLPGQGASVLQIQHFIKSLWFQFLKKIFPNSQSSLHHHKPPAHHLSVHTGEHHSPENKWILSANNLQHLLFLQSSGVSVEVKDR